MSLINQMLNDLDARRADAGGGRLPNEVRPLPAERRRSSWPRVIAGLLLALVAAGVWWAGRLSLPGSPAPAREPVVRVPEIPGLPVLPPVAEPAPIATTPPPPVDVASPETSPRPLGRSTEPALRLAQSVQLPAARLPPPVAANVRSQTAAPPAAASEVARIDKQAHQPSPRERSEGALRAAMALVDQGRTDAAAEALRTVVRDDPAHQPSRQLLLKILLDSRAYDELRGVLQSGLEQAPRQAAWALLLSRLLIDRGEPDAALRVLRTPELNALGNADLRGAAAAILHRLGRHAEAESAYAEALRIDAGNGRWWLGLALANEAQGKAREAREALQRARAAGGLSADLQAFVDEKLK